LAERPDEALDEKSSRQSSLDFALNMIVEFNLPLRVIGDSHQ
jgi:hypothetical protein